MSENNPEPQSAEASAAKTPLAGSELGAPAVPPKKPVFRRVFLMLLCAVVIYLAGYIPLKLEMRKLVLVREVAKANLRVKQIQVALASAAVDARRGEYELARREAATFFSNLGEELRMADTVFPAEQHASLEELLRDRDELITLLARSDPASAERLANLYVAFRQIMEKSIQPVTE